MTHERHDLEPAFVVHLRPYRETSALLELLTRNHGRVCVVARGCKRPRSPLRLLLQPFEPLLVSWSARGELGTLRDAERAWVAVPLSGAALLSGLYMNELVVRLTHRFDPHPGLFDAYVQALRQLATPTSMELTLRRFEKQLLEEVGYGLMLEREASSGAPVRAGMRYRYLPQSGPIPATGAGGTGVPVSGHTLLALAANGSLDASMRREAKRLMRSEIDSLLGDRPLTVRRLSRRGTTRTSQ